MIPHSRPSLGEEEAEAAARVVRSGHLAQGPEVARLEGELADRVGVSHAVAVSSGTAALHLALLALGVGPGDEVAFPSYVCSALLHATRHAGAAPRLLDLAPDTFHVDPAEYGRAADTCAAIIVPHLFGEPAPLPSSRNSVPVIEDCAMALGARTTAGPVGSQGTLSVFSFYATKVICGGEGGAVATDDEGVAAALRDARDYDGRSADRTRFNYKLTDVHAAVARAQLRRLDGFVARRRELANFYTETLQGSRAVLPDFAAGAIPFRYVVRVPDAGGAAAAFEAAGVRACAPVFEPNHVALRLPDDDFPVTARAQREALSIPLYPSLTDEETRTVAHVARGIL